MAKQKSTSGNRAANGPPSAARGDRLAAYFLSLSLENVRCFGPKQTLDLSDANGKPARWTVILGINGTGKTTLLQSLAGFDLLPRPVLGTKPGKGPTPRLLDPSMVDVFSFRREGNQNAAVLNATFSASVSLSGPAVKNAACGFEILSGSVYFGSQGIVTPPWCCAYGAGRRMGAASLSESELDDPAASLFSDKADLRNPEEWLLRLDYAASKPASDGDEREWRLQQVKELLLSVLPEEETSDIRFTSSGGTHPSPRVEFKTPYGWVPLRQLGYGYQTLITWVADFTNRMMERYPEPPGSLGEPAVVLVDEIDLHLHPQWQRKLIGFLTDRFPNTQFIVTAHSPLVVQAAADANLAVLKREGDHVIIDNDVDNIRNLRVDQILTSDLFGLATARPPHIEPLILERIKLLSKPKLTAADQRRVKEIEAQIGELPFGETAEEIRERKEIRETLEMLKERDSSR